MCTFLLFSIIIINKIIKIVIPSGPCLILNNNLHKASVYNFCKIVYSSRYLPLPKQKNILGDVKPVLLEGYRTLTRFTYTLCLYIRTYENTHTYFLLVCDIVWFVLYDAQPWRIQFLIPIYSLYNRLIKAYVNFRCYLHSVFWISRQIRRRVSIQTKIHLGVIWPSIISWAVSRD